MTDMMDVAVTGVNAAEQRLEAVSSNIANLQTIAYKKQQTITQTIASDQASFVNGVVAQSRTDFSRGPVVKTDRSLDMVMNANTFFEVHVGNQREFSNVGRLTVNQDGYLSDVNGFALTDNIRLDANDRVMINKDGTVQVVRRGDSLVVGHITLYRLGREDNILSTEHGLYTVKDASYIQRLDEQDTQVMAGYLEGSNVGFTEEITEMMAAQRQYQLNSRMISVADDLSQTDIDLLRE